MRLPKIMALILAVASCPSPTFAQEGSSAEPSIDDRPLDLAARQSPWGRWNIDMTDHDRVYAIGALARAISVTDPYNNMLLGIIRLEGGATRKGMESPSRRSIPPTFGYAPNGRTLAIASEASHSVTFLDTRSNSVVYTAMYDYPPAGVTFSPNGKEVWIPVKGKNYVSIFDAKRFAEIARIPMPDEPGPTVLSNNGRYAYVCSGSGFQTMIVDVTKHTIVASVLGGGVPCTSIAASPDGRQIWLTSERAGTALAFSAKPPFEALRSVDTGPRTSHVSFASNDDGQFAYVSVGGANAVKVFDTQSFKNVSTIRLGTSPSGLWPSGDGSRMYVALNEDGALAVIDTATMKYVDLVKVDQPVQAVVYVPNAVRSVRENPHIEASPTSQSR
jgi:DNA-binding beta-propeller fold protein YncE